MRERVHRFAAGLLDLVRTEVNRGGVVLNPGSGVGIVVTLGVNPAYPCARLGDRPAATLVLPSLAVRFSSYGVTSTQALAADNAPVVTGLTRASCEAATTT